MASSEGVSEVAKQEDVGACPLASEAHDVELPDKQRAGASPPSVATSARPAPPPDPAPAIRTAPAPTPPLPPTPQSQSQSQPPSSSISAATAAERSPPTAIQAQPNGSQTIRRGRGRPPGRRPKAQIQTQPAPQPQGLIQAQTSPGQLHAPDQIQTPNRPSIPDPIRAPDDGQKAAFLYHTLSSMDPYHSTPMDFIHLLVKAAVRDNEIAYDIKQLQARWNADPAYQSIIASQQTYKNPFMGPNGQPPPPPPPPPPPHHENRHLMPAQSLPQPHGKDQGPLRPPPGPPSRQKPGATGTQWMPPVINPITSLPPHVRLRQATANGPPPASISAPPVVEGEEDDEPHAPNEKPVNFTSMLNSAEAELGWTGKYEKLSEIRQESSGWQAAQKIGKILDKMSQKATLHLKFANRVHILTVIREIIMSVLETQGTRVATEVRNMSGNYDVPLLASVKKLTDGQRRRLGKLENGKWMQEFLETVELANKQDMFPRVKEAYDLINNQT
ncbi:hypothetical protein SUNI508_08565 [Seiridium unicorne]|uniref:Uncharacterized protein n=1 Tax=Seiridium unicorne TaxID=138068 RepID=A0ABR2UTG8_9PEZI